MAVTSRDELKEYCLRRLGKPVININADDTQLEDRIDDALEIYTEKHYDATQEDWVSYVLTQTDIDNGYLTIPNNILVIMEILPFSEIVAYNNMFSYQYQIMANTLSPWQPFDQIDYYLKMMDYQNAMDMTTANPRFEFTRHAHQLKIHTNLDSLGVDFPLGVRVQRILDPETYTDVYNDKWLKEYCTSLFKRQWGENTKKFSGIQMLGGVEINGQQIYDEAVAELEKLEETLENTYMEPCSFIFG